MILSGSQWRYLAKIAVLSLLYVAAAKLGSWITGLHELVPPIYPSAGITQAALFLLGPSLWPGVLLGEFLAARTLAIPWTVAWGIALGCTLQALCGVRLARLWRICPSLRRLRDVLGFILCMVILSTFISPTIGLTSLFLGGQIARSSLTTMWWAWWVANAIAVLVITSLLLVWFYPVVRPVRTPKTTTQFWGRHKSQLFWALIWLISLITVSELIFKAHNASGVFLFGQHRPHLHYPLKYLLFPFIVWAALQFGQRGAVLGTLIVSGMAIRGAALGDGLFITKTSSLSEAILLLQPFIAVIAITALVLAAIMTERAAAEVKYRNIFENTVEGIFQVSADGAYISANPALARMYGYYSPVELIASLTDIAEQLYVERQCYGQLNQQLQQQDRVLGFESQVYRKDGRVIWVSQNVRAVRDFRGSLLYYEGTVEDITERKAAQEALAQEHQELESRVEERTAALRESNRQLRREIVDHKRVEKALRESERRFRAIFDGTFQFIVLLAPNGTVLEVNDGLSFAKIDAIDVLAQPLWEGRWWMSSETKEQLKNAIASAASGEFVRYETAIFGADHTVAMIDFSLKPFRDDFGQVILLIAEGHDITERKRTEAALRESEERFALAIQANDNGLFDINLKTNNYYYSPQCRHLIGYPLEQEGPTFAEFLTLVHPEDVDAVQSNLEAIFTGEKSQWKLEFRLFHADGSQPWLLSRGLALRGENDQVVRVVGTHTDISDRKLAEAECRKSEERFRQLAENIHEVFWMSSLEPAQILYVSPGYERVWGRSCESLYQHPSDWLDSIHAIDRDRIFAVLYKQQQGEYDEEYRIVQPDGIIRWVRDRVFPIHDQHGCVYRLAGIAEDITTRKQAEAELQRQNRQRQLFAEITLKIRQSLQLEAILQTTVNEVRQILQVDRVIVYQLKPDTSGSVVTESVVPEWTSILGQIIYDPCFAQVYIHQYRQGRIRAIENLQQAEVQPCYVEMLQDFGVKANLVVPILQRDNLWGLLIAHQCTSSRQWQTFEIELLRQLADQVGIALAQSQLLEKETKTTQQLAQQNLHLEQARREAEAASRAKSEFLANMSHELRTPLNGILGYTQVLKREALLSTKQQHGLEIIQKCGEHLLTLLNDILDLSKIEARKMELFLSDFQFPEFLENLIEMVRIRAEQKHIFFNYEQLSELPACVRGDEKRLRQVLINLLGNAVKFTDSGGVTLKVGYVNTANSNLDNLSSIQKTELSNKIRFLVEDTGIGIAPEQLSEIFMPFHQSGEPHRQVDGTGLGLAISKRLVQMMDASLQVKSTLGKGSVFWVDLDLPEVYLPHKIKQSNQKIIGFQGQRRQVLIADDREENRSIFVNLLSPLGFDVSEARDGQDCFNQTLQLKPDLIILNPIMPELDGLEVTRQIRHSPNLKNVIILATSASVFDDNKQECLAVGCDGFISQPLQTEQLFEQLQVQLNLEWIYEESRPEIVSFSSLADPGSTENSLIVPPEAEITTLYELAMMGDIKGICNQANKIQQLDEQFTPFAQQLCQLAEGFQEKKILEFVKQYVQKE